MEPARVEVLRETVKVARFELPPEALPEENEAQKTSVVTVATPAWERRVAATLWVIAAAIVMTLWFARS